MTDAAKSKEKLLVPVNFSKKSELALDFALQYAERVPADIYMFHVFEGSSKNYRELDRFNEELMDRMKTMMLHGIERARSKGILPAVESVHRRMAHGKPANEILKMAEGIGADIVVLGHPTSSAFKKFIEKAPCSLVLVKEKDIA